MYKMKMILDTDGVIKLTHARVIDTVAHHETCLLTEEVYEEVLQGKKKVYEDAFIIEILIEEKKIKLLSIKRVSPPEGIGKGEWSCYIAFQEKKGDLIVSDDKKFLSRLRQEEIPFLIPSDIIVWLVKKNNLLIQEGFQALDRIYEKISSEAYIEAQQQLESAL